MDDAAIDRFVQAFEAKGKAKAPFLWERDQLYTQPLWAYNNERDEWGRQYTDGGAVRPTQEEGAPAGESVSQRLHLLSWNIDFMLPAVKERVERACEHLEAIVSASTTPTFILLQEMLEEGLEVVKSREWVRKGYFLTDISSESFESTQYGTVILVPRCLFVKQVFRVHYSKTRMHRDALFVDVALGQGDKPWCRIGTTHLESLVAVPPRRPSQLAVASQYMHQAPVSIITGDFNAIQPFDMEDLSAASVTWGPTAKVRERKQFGDCRMDKMLYCSAVADAVAVESFGVFGSNVEVHDEAVKKRLVDEGELAGGFVSDHLGIRAEFTLRARVAV